MKKTAKKTTKKRAKRRKPNPKETPQTRKELYSDLAATVNTVKEGGAIHIIEPGKARMEAINSVASAVRDLAACLRMPVQAYVKHSVLITSPSGTPAWPIESTR